MTSTSGRAPDSAMWTMPGHSGVASITSAPDRIVLTIALPRPLERDTLAVELRTLSMTTLRAWYAVGADGTLRRCQVERDSLALLLLDRIDSLHRAEPVAFPRTRAGVQQAYVQALLAGDPKVAGFPARCPKGLDTAEIYRLALVQSASLGSSLGTIARRWSLGIDSTQARTRILRLASEGGPIARVQLEALFPGDRLAIDDHEPPSLSWKTPSRTLVLEFGDSILAMGLRVEDASIIDSVRIGGVLASSADSLWAAQVRIPVSDTGIPILAKAWDHHGNHASTSLRIFRRPAPATGAPVVRLLSPSKAGVVLPFETPSVRVQWSIRDAQGIDNASVRIRGADSIHREDSVWSASVSVPASGEEFTITLQVRNLAGIEASDFLVVLRAKDTAAPVILPNAEAIDRSVDFDTSETTVSWRVTDNGRIAAVRIGDSLVAGLAGVYRRRIDLSPGRNAVEILAVDSFGNMAKDTVHILRQDDILPPKIRAVQGFSSRTVAWADSTVRVDWVVADDGKAMDVSIDGVAMNGVLGEYSRTVPLRIGRNVVRIEAVDRAGNLASDSAILLRQGPLPTFSPDGGSFVGTVYDTIRAPGADRIEYSTDGGATWTRFEGVATIPSSRRLHARAWYGGVPSEASTDFLVSSVRLCPGPISWSSFFLKGDSLWATGYNAYGQLGLGDRLNRPQPVFVMTDVASVAAGTEHALIVRKDGSLWAMGRNNHGQLGDGTTIDRLRPVKVMDSVASVSAGGSQGGAHSLITRLDGSLWATGDNSCGQLGDSTMERRLRPVQIAREVKSASAGSMHSVFVKSDGSLWGMGFNGFGQLGDSTVENRPVPIRILAGVRSASAGGTHSMAVKTDGTVWAMGDNAHGQLGDGTRVERHVPVPVQDGMREVHAGNFRTLFLKTDGRLLAAGWNEHGDLGDGTTVDRETPVLVMTEVQDVALGIYHTSARKVDESLWIYGWNNYGQLGIGVTLGPTGEVFPAPVRMNF